MAKGAQVTTGLTDSARQQIVRDLERRRLGTDESRAAFVAAVDEACAIYGLQPAPDRDLERDRLARLQQAAQDFAKQAQLVSDDADLAGLVQQMLVADHRDGDALATARDKAEGVNKAVARLCGSDYACRSGRPKDGAADQLVADVATAWQEHLGKPSAAREGHFASIMRIVLPDREIGESRLRRLLQ